MLSPVFLTLLLIAADDGKEEAKRLINEGNQAFALQDYRSALDSFQKAYDAYPSPKILVNLGETHRSLGNWAQAVSCFEQFLREAKSDPLAPQIVGLIAELEPKIARIVIDAADVEVSIDGERVEGTRIAVSPGRHEVVLRKEGHRDIVRTTTVAAGSMETIAVVLEPVALVPPPQIEEPIAGKWWFWAGAGVLAIGVVGVVVGIALNTGGDDFVPAGELPPANTSDWETF
jgi:tetratricopeptide (TPR) repeat protein